VAQRSRQNFERFLFPALSCRVRALTFYLKKFKDFVKFQIHTFSTKMNGKNENLISIDEVIERAKKLGVDFGKGNPRNRLRYYVKIGLLPHAHRKVFKNNLPQGAYPEEIVWKLFEIDKKIKSGKSILQIKKEMEEESKKEATEKVVILPKVEGESFVKTQQKISFLKVLPIIFVIFFAISFVVYSLIIRSEFKKSISHFLATTIATFRKFTQAPAEGETQKESVANVLETEPYLTINAETAIQGSLNVRDVITSPSFVIKRENYNATLTTSPLTADRTYTFPDQSGVVCLSTGNCFGLGGEVTSVEGTPNRLAKFLGERRIGNSSIADFFAGVSITIDNIGNVGVGTATPRGRLDVAGNLLTSGNILTSGNLITSGNLGVGIDNPQYSVHVRGRIQATDDICTDLGGGKCLSQLAPPSPPVIIERRGARGIEGSGTPNYIPLWTTATALGNSILSQTGSTLSLEGNMNILGILTTSGLKIATTTQAGYILVAADDQGNITFAPPPTGTIPAGTKLLRASLPIFKYSNPAQTATTSFVAITNKISTSTLTKILPSQIPNSYRKFALLLKFADNIPQNASSSWQIDFDTLPDFDFEFRGQNLSSLETGILHLQDEIQNLGNDNWVLKVKVPDNQYSLRIFNIFLLCYDEIF